MATRKRPLRTRSNHGYENQAAQALTLHERANRSRRAAKTTKTKATARRLAARSAVRVRKNSTIPIGDTVRTRAMGQRISKRAKGIDTQDAMLLDIMGNPSELMHVRRRKRARKNTAHVPRTGRGPKGSPRWFILDLYNGRGTLVSTRVRKGTHAALSLTAANLVDRRVGSHIVREVELSGPYRTKPTASTERK